METRQYFQNETTGYAHLKNGTLPHMIHSKYFEMDYRYKYKSYNQKACTRKPKIISLHPWIWQIIAQMGHRK